MKIILCLKITIDLDDIKKRLVLNPVQRLTDCFKVESYIEKLK